MDGWVDGRVGFKDWGLIILFLFFLLCLDGVGG